MGNQYLLGVDIGTYESKGVLTTLDGRVVNTQVRPHDLLIPRQGWAEHDPESSWWGDFCAITNALIKESAVSPGDIIAVGCSAIGPDMLPVDRDCRPLRNGVLYGIDTRATNEIRSLNEKLGPETVFRHCGNALTTQAVGPKILWLANNEPENYRKAYKIVSATTFLVARLTGEWWIDHYTASNFVPCYDMAAQKWNEDFCEGIIEPERLPDIGWTADLAGKVTRKAAEETGLAEGTPVVIGTIDAAAEAVSVGVVSPGDTMLMYGSTLFIIQVVGSPISDTRLWSAPYLFPGTFSLMAGMATTGVLTRWFRDNMARDLVEAEKAGGENAYARLARDAAAIPPGAEGLLVLPYFSGERTPINDPRARGVFFGLTLAHSREHLYRAILEGVGHGIRQHLDILESIGAAPKNILAVGGGTKNPLWLQIVSDICGKVQKVPRVTVGASYGDAFLAGLGVGAFSSYRDIHGWVREVREVPPDEKLAGLYSEYHKLYIDLYLKSKDIMHALSALV